MSPLLIVILIIVIFLGFYLYSEKQTGGLLHFILGLVEVENEDYLNIVHRMSTGRHFVMPDDESINSSLEYCNIAHLPKSKFFNLIYFNSDGIQAELHNITKRKWRSYTKSGRWQLKHIQNPTNESDNGYTMQFERERLK